MMREVVAAGAIIDVMMGGKFDWRSRIEDSDFLESADWQQALLYARAALSSVPVKKYSGNHSVALQFLFENETDGCPNCRGCAEHRCSSAPVQEVEPHYYYPSFQHMGDCHICGHEQDSVLHIGSLKFLALSSALEATISGPVARDMSKFSLKSQDDPLARIPEGYSAPLDNRTTAEVLDDMETAKSSVPEATVSATPEQIEISKCWQRLEESGFPPEASGWPFQDIRGALPNAIDAALDCLIRQREDLLAEVTKLRASPQDVGREATIEEFAKSLDERAAGFLARSYCIFNGRLVAEELTNQALALRSLSRKGGER